MERYYYRIDHSRLRKGRLPEIPSGMYKGKLEIHVKKSGIEDPATIPIMLERDIPWEERQRSNVLDGTNVAIEFPDGMQEFEVVCDYDTVDSQCVVVVPLGEDQDRHRLTSQL